MATREELEALSSKQLHDQAFSRAEHHLDVGFFYRLIEELPAAAAATGDIERSHADVFALRSLLTDFFASDEGELADALRPFYIDYLTTHGG